MNGKIALEIPGSITPKYGTYPFFFHLIFIPDGANKTLAEMDAFEYAKYDYMRKGIVDMLKKMNSKVNSPKQYTIFDYL